MANYILHNIGYGNPVNFREVVLSTLKGFGVCGHLRDYPISQIGTTDVKKWYATTDYEEGNLKHWKENTEQKKKQLQTILGGDESVIEAEYEKEKELISYYKDCEHSYYDDEILKAKKSVAEYSKYLGHFQTKMNNEFYVAFDKELREITETAIRDIKEMKGESAKSLCRAKQKKLPDYASFRDKYIENLRNGIRHGEEHIASIKRAIRRISENNAIIKEVFEAIEEAEKRIKESEGTE